MKNKEEVVEQMWEPVCNATRLAAGSNFMLHALRLLACSAKRLATIWTMLNTVDIVSITTRNWLAYTPFQNRRARSIDVLSQRTFRLIFRKKVVTLKLYHLTSQSPLIMARQTRLLKRKQKHRLNLRQVVNERVQVPNPLQILKTNPILVRV